MNQLKRPSEIDSPEDRARPSTANRSLNSPTEVRWGTGKLVSHCAKPDPCLDTVALVLAGGRGTRLLPLTINRCKPAVPFGGTFRIIDFALSNCINSGIRQIGVLTQYAQHSLIQHLHEAWSFLRRDLREFIDVMPAQQQLGASWYRGTADAVTQNMDFLQRLAPRFTLIVAGDHIYKADYRRMIQKHLECNAAVTIACCEVPLEVASQFGVVTADASGRITGFAEKPAQPTHIPGRPGHTYASMGVYVFNTNLLTDCLLKDRNRPGSTHDFGRDIIPALIHSTHVQAYGFDTAQTEHYWRDVGTVDAFYEANMQLLRPEPALELHDPDWPIHTRVASSCPTRIVVDSLGHSGLASDCIVAAGCLLRGSRIRHSLLFTDVHVDEQTQIDDSVVLPGAVIGKRCRIRGTIIDAHTHIADGVEIGYDRQQDVLRYHVTERGVVVVTQPSSESRAGRTDDTDQCVSLGHSFPLQVHG